jgi:phosphoglycolate phosphatase
VKLILFDVDGTLVDSQHLIIAALGTAFSAHGLEPASRERSLSIVGLSLVEAFTVLVGAEGPVDSLVQAYRDAFNGLRADPANDEPLYPGATACLDALSRRDDVVLGIATGKSRRGVNHLLEQHGWRDLFATVQTADDAPSKPHPAMIEQAMAEVGVAAPDTMMVGDSSFDMAMAQAAGVRPIGVSWGFQSVEMLEKAGAEFIAHSYPELLELLEGMLAPSNWRRHAPISGR